MNQKEMEAQALSAEKDLASAKWELVDYKGEEKLSEGSKFYKGSQESGSGWSYVVCSFSLESQGFPAGTRGYDGACMNANVMLHMMRDLAEKACKLAEAYLAEKRN